MRVRIEWHDYRLKVFFDVLESLARGCAVAVNERLLAEGSPEQGVQVATDHILPQVVQDALLVVVNVEVLVLMGHLSFILFLITSKSGPLIKEQICQNSNE